MTNSLSANNPKTNPSASSEQPKRQTQNPGFNRMTSGEVGNDPYRKTGISIFFQDLTNTVSVIYYAFQARLSPNQKSRCRELAKQSAETLDFC
jgi:hypothetical protein